MGNSMGANIIIIVVSLVIGVSMIPVLDVAINDTPGMTGAIGSEVRFTSTQVSMYCGPSTTVPTLGTGGSLPGPMFCTVANNAILGPFFTLLPLIVIVLLITGSMAYMKNKN